MATIRYIALLRGINVGGNNIIKMTDLRDCLEKAGFRNVRTYIASGNVLFESSDSQEAVEATLDSSLKATFEYNGPTVVITELDLATIMREAPKAFGTQPDIYHSDVIFLKSPANPTQVLQDVLGLKLRDDIDTAAAGSKALYFTRLSEQRTKSRMNKITALPSYKSMTIRNWNTVTKLRALLDAE